MKQYSPGWWAAAQAAMEADPDCQRQVAEFVALMNERPCAVCGSPDHSGTEGEHDTR